MPRKIVLCLAFCVLAFGNTSSANTRQIKIKGYVTNVVSPTQFDIEDYRITRDATFALEFDNATPELLFRPENIKVGVELEIKGDLDESTGTLHATAIKVDLEQFKRAKHTAIIAYPPVRVTRDGVGWSGRFVADGQRIEVTPATQVLFKLTSREQKLAKAAAKTPDEGEDTGFEPLRSLDQVTAGMLMSYEGPRDFDGTIKAEKVTFSRNDLEKGEAKLWNSIVSEVKGFADGKPQLKISGVGKFKLLNDERVQTYVGAMGQSLVPSHQRELGMDDPRRINFRFFVVDEKEPNAFALPNGILVINAGLFGVLENEAQLASIVGHEIAHATQEHTWRQMQFHKKKKIGLMIGAAIAQAYGKYNLADVFTMTVAAIQNGYSRSLENQADRVGMEYMVAAGYDPRQAPQVWKAMTKVTGLHGTDFFWSSHDNNATRRSYLMNELKMNYADLNYSTLKTEPDAFLQMRDRVLNSAGSKIKLRVTDAPATTRMEVAPSRPTWQPALAASAPLETVVVEPRLPVAAPPPAAPAVTSVQTIAPAPPPDLTRQVIGPGTVIYRAPDTTLQPLRTINDTLRVKVLAHESGWYRVEFKDPDWGTRVGFIREERVGMVAR